MPPLIGFRSGPCQASGSSPLHGGTPPLSGFGFSPGFSDEASEPLSPDGCARTRCVSSVDSELVRSMRSFKFSGASRIVNNYNSFLAPTRSFVEDTPVCRKLASGEKRSFDSSEFASMRSLPNGRIGYDRSSDPVQSVPRGILPSKKREDICGANLLFVYGTLKKGFRNHYNMLKSGISYKGEGITAACWPLYLDPSKRFRPCLLNKSGIGQQVRGELYSVDDFRLVLLDIFERVPGQYCRESLDVIIDANTVLGGLAESRSDCAGKDHEERTDDSVDSAVIDRKIVRAYAYFIDKDTTDAVTNMIISNQHSLEFLHDYTLQHHALYQPRSASILQGREPKEIESHWLNTPTSPVFANPPSSGTSSSEVCEHEYPSDPDGIRRIPSAEGGSNWFNVESHELRTSDEEGENCADLDEYEFRNATD